jgi:hypothetical protein
MHFRFLAALLLGSSFAAAAWPAPAPTGPKVYVEPSVSYRNGATPDSQVVNPDCHWNSFVVERLVKEAEGRVVIVPGLAGVSGRKLALVASASSETAPASELSTRWLEISAKLSDEQGNPIAASVFRRETDSGTLQQCKNVKDIAENLGNDIASWLENPVDGIKIPTAMTAMRADVVDAEFSATCPWQQILPRYLAENSEGAAYRVSEDIESAKGRKLSLKVANVRVAGGGWVSGAKWLKVVGSLSDDKGEIGNFVALRHSLKSYTRCGTFEQVSKEMSEDILNWIRHPSMNAKLGNADATDQPEP